MKEGKIMKQFTGYYFLVISIVAFLIVTYFSYIYIEKSITLLGIPPMTLTILGFFTYFFVIIIVAKWYVQEKTFGKSHKIIKIVKKINIWTILTLYLVISVFVIGLVILSEEYKIQLPFKVNFKLENSRPEDYSNVNLQNLTCKSKSDFNNFVQGDRLYCDFEISSERNVTNETLGLQRAYVRQYLSSNDTFRYPFTLESEPARHEKQVSIIIDVPEDATWIKAWVIAQLFSETGNNYAEYASEFEGTVFTRYEYMTLERQKIPLILAVLSFASFSIIVAIKNLRDIIEDRK